MSTPEVKPSKYFTPSIEDIRVGYECEFWADPSKEDKGWIPFIIKTFPQAWDNDLGHHYSFLRSLRVPYLTKEQIEAEGWKPEGRISPKKFKKDIDEKSYYELTLNDDNQIVITKTFIDGWAWVWKPFYSGECKDINTFCYITKLLGIQ